MDPSKGKTEASSYREPDKAWSSASPAEETVEWIVTFKPASGIIVKVEKLHSESGERQELSIEEYGALAAMGISVTVPSNPASADSLPATDMSQVYYQAYYQGIYDYAYYQGIYDYANYLAGPYYQNLADGSLSSNPEDPIEAQRLRLANYAAVHTSPGAGTGS
jgi:hypothetical protein